MHRRSLTLSFPSGLAAALFLLISGAVVADQPAGYSFTPVAFLGDPAPGGGKFSVDFEPSRLNNRGDLAFAADLNDQQQEGIFLYSGGQITQIVRYGQPAPGGGTFGAGVLGLLGSNDTGDLALAFTLEPFPAFPLGLNGGLFRWSRQTQSLNPVLLPKTTAAPGGGTFAGPGFNVALNNRGEIIFSALTLTDKGIHIPGEEYVGYGVGAYLADAQGQITAVARPGDTAPGGKPFDMAFGTGINDRGDVVFLGHLAGDPCGAQPQPQSTLIQCYPDVYVKPAATGQIDTIVRVGDPLPDGGTLVASGLAHINNAGDILFSNVLTPAVFPSKSALYLHSQGKLARIVGGDDAMPGGGKITFIGAASLNNKGDVSFNAALDNGEQGEYLYSQGTVGLIAKSGTDIPGAGAIAHLEQGTSAAPGTPSPPAGFPAVWQALNERGQVAFVATLKDGRIALLLATPQP